jgi:hypothetical protein
MGSHFGTKFEECLDFRRHGYNQFADKTNSHDGKAQIVIDQAKKKRSK